MGIHAAWYTHALKSPLEISADLGHLGSVFWSLLLELKLYTDSLEYVLATILREGENCLPIDPYFEKKMKKIEKLKLLPQLLLTKVSLVRYMMIILQVYLEV